MAELDLKKLLEGLDIKGLLDMIGSQGAAVSDREMNMNKGILNMEYAGGGSFQDLGMTEREIGKYPDVGWTNMDDSPEIQQFLNNMPHADRVKVEAMRQRLEQIGQADKFPNFINDLMSGNTGSGALQADPLPEFQQYQTGNNLQNLGFVGGTY